MNVVFFFKRKTAYVLRISDCRSDVCSSDLDTRTNVPEIRSFVLAILQADTFGVSIGRVLRAQADEMRIKRRQLAQERAQKAPEIGRASCRERVCQYV